MRTFAARTWSRAGCGHGRGADVDCFRTGRGRGLDRATASGPGYGADIPRPNREHFADAESFASEGVRLVRVKSLQVKASEGDQCAMSKAVTLRQIRCRLLPYVDTAANAARFVGRMANGMVSSLFRLRLKARQPREIRLGRMLADAPLTSRRSRVEAVRVNRRFDCGSPIAASRSFRPGFPRLPP